MTTASSATQGAQVCAHAPNESLAVRLVVVDQHGRERSVIGAVGRRLMEVLRELDYGVAAVCGGLCSCATCHVYVDDEWIARLPACQSDERDALSDLTHYRERHSRLSCQLQVTRELDGLRLAIAPDE